MKKLVAMIVVLTAVAVVNTGCEKAKTTTPSGDKSLTLTKPGNHSIKQGDTTSVKVSISRKGFSDPIDVKFQGLPDGVTVQETDMTVPKNSDSATFNLKAKDDAKTGDHAVTVDAHGGGLDAKETFTLTVKPKS
jgi:uncharacterized membrane protein